jgi:putative two-component system response regulator
MEATEYKPTVLVTPSKPTILVVDDAEENLMIMEAILGEMYSLRLISNAKDALDYAFATPPDLILLDIMMPEIDGFEVCRRLKAKSNLADVPVLFITAKSDIEDEEMGFSLGASDFIHKPISAPIVAARVKTHLKIKFMLDYLRRENLRLKETASHTSEDLAEITKMLWGSPFSKF